MSGQCPFGNSHRPYSLPLEVFVLCIVQLTAIVQTTEQKRVSAWYILQQLSSVDLQHGRVPYRGFIKRDVKNVHDVVSAFNILNKLVEGDGVYRVIDRFAFPRG